MSWPMSKLDLINAALLGSANNPVNVADDGSDEWAVASSAYEFWIEYLYDQHNWKEITKIATLNPLSSAPQDTQFDTAYAKPQDCIHIIWLRLSDLPVVYRITGNHIEMNAAGGPNAPTTTTPGVVTMKYVSSDPQGNNSDAFSQMQRSFAICLTLFVKAQLYEAAEYYDVAKQWFAMAEKELAQARARSDQDEPKRAMWNSRWTASRRVRRPFPPVPSGWGGSGIPG